MGGSGAPARGAPARLVQHHAGSNSGSMWCSSTTGPTASAVAPRHERAATVETDTIGQTPGRHSGSGRLVPGRDALSRTMRRHLGDKTNGTSLWWRPGGLGSTGPHLSGRRAWRGRARRIVTRRVAHRRWGAASLPGGGCVTWQLVSCRAAPRGFDCCLTRQANEPPSPPGRGLRIDQDGRRVGALNPWLPARAAAAGRAGAAYRAGRARPNVRRSSPPSGERCR